MFSLGSTLALVLFGGLTAVACKSAGPSREILDRQAEARREKNLDSMSQIPDSSIDTLVGAAESADGEPTLLIPFLPTPSKPRGKNKLTWIKGVDIGPYLWEISEAYFQTDETPEAHADCLLKLRIKGGAYATFPSLFAFKNGYAVDQKACRLPLTDPNQKLVQALERFFRYRSCPNLSVSKFESVSQTLRYTDKCTAAGTFILQKATEETIEIDAPSGKFFSKLNRNLTQGQADSLPCALVTQGSALQFTRPCLTTLVTTRSTKDAAELRVFSQLTLHETGWRPKSATPYPKSGFAKIEINDWQGSLFFEARGKAPTYIIDNGRETRRGLLSALNPNTP